MEKKLKLSVDNHPFETDEQFLTGLQIKERAGIPAENDLYLVVPGYEDELIDNNKSVNFARPGVERFVSRKHGSGITLIVNAIPVSHTAPATSVSYEQIVAYAFPKALSNGEVGYTVTYCDGPTSNPEGVLVKGQRVFTKHHMRFDVTATHKS